MKENIGDNKLRSILEHILIELIKESRMKAFKSEDQVQGYILGILRQKEGEYRYDIKREVPTTIKYSKTEEGILLNNPEGKNGYIDIRIKSDYATCGIEIEYPRGQGRMNPTYFIGHIKNDCIKLSNENLNHRIVLLLIYQDSPIDSDEIIKIIKEYPDILFLYLRLRRQNEFESEIDSPVLYSFMHPKEWIKLSVVPSK